MVPERVVSWGDGDAGFDGEFFGRLAVGDSCVYRAGFEEVYRDGGVALIPGNFEGLGVVGDLIVDEGVGQG